MYARKPMVAERSNTAGLPANNREQPGEQPAPCIVLGNEPRAYREAIAEALRTLRPRYHLCVVEQAALDETVTANRPMFVIYSEESAVVEASVLDWVLLYPEGARVAIHGNRGRTEILGDVTMQMLIEFADDAAAGHVARPATHAG